MTKITPDIKKSIVSMLQRGKSLRHVAREIGVSKSSVENIKNAHCIDYEGVKGGRPKLLSPADERYCVRQVTKYRVSSATKVAKMLEVDLGIKASGDTVRRALHKAGLIAKASSNNQKKRREWGEAST